MPVALPARSRLGGLSLPAKDGSAPAPPEPREGSPCRRSDGSEGFWRKVAGRWFCIGFAPTPAERAARTIPQLAIRITAGLGGVLLVAIGGFAIAGDLTVSSATRRVFREIRALRGGRGG